MSFKKYLESKEVLKQAVNTIPRQLITYDVNKYCSLAVLINNRKDKLRFKPRQSLQIEWLYEHHSNPTMISIVVDDKYYYPGWSQQKIEKWLETNTTMHDALQD